MLIIFGLILEFRSKFKGRTACGRRLSYACEGNRGLHDGSLARKCFLNVWMARSVALLWWICGGTNWKDFFCLGLIWSRWSTHYLRCIDLVVLPLTQVNYWVSSKRVRFQKLICFLMLLLKWHWHCKNNKLKRNCYLLKIEQGIVLLSWCKFCL